MAQTTDKRTGTVSRTKKPLTEAQRSHIMSKIRGKDTKPEVRLRKALWHKGAPLPQELPSPARDA